MFHDMVKIQHNIVMKCFHCDSDGEHTLNELFELLEFDSTIHQTSCTYTPQ